MDLIRVTPDRHIPTRIDGDVNTFATRPGSAVWRQTGVWHATDNTGDEPNLSIETTTGPLGQGISNAVGMALAEKMLASQFNRPGFDVVDHSSWPGCLTAPIVAYGAALVGFGDLRL